MATFNDDKRSKLLSRVGSNRWTRVRQAYQAGELGRQNVLFRSEHKRQRRNALADISSISTNANASCQKHKFHQLVERVRELQNEIVPDLLLYQMPSAYSSFSSIPQSSNVSGGSLPTYPHRQSISLSSGSINSSVSNQRLGLSSRIIERAHQIPERFWIEWQQKQMQDQIDELEYIKNNIGCSPSSSLLSNEIDENGMEYSTLDRRTNYDEMRRQSLLFLHQAQRLANQRRVSLAQTTTPNEPKLKKIKNESHSFDNDDHNSFSFDQRSDEDMDTANLIELNEDPPEPLTPIPTIQQSQPTLDRSRLSISLPFTYTNTVEERLASRNYRHISIEPIFKKIIEVNDNSTQTISPTPSIEDVAQIDTEFNLILVKHENPTQVNPLLYSKATVSHSIEFHKFRSISPRNNLTSLKQDKTIHIPTMYNTSINGEDYISLISNKKEIEDRRPSSPTFSFKSARSRLSSIDDDEDLDDDIQSTSIIPSLLSVSSRSQSTSSHIISTITQFTNNNNNYPSLQQVSNPKYTCSIQSMTDVDNLEEKYYSSSSSGSIILSDEEDNLSYSHTLFTCRHHQRRRKKKSNTSNLSSLSTSSSQNNLALLRDSFCQAKENNNNNNNIKRTLKIAHNTSITSSKRTWQWKRNSGGFQRDVLTSNNKVDGEDYIIRSSSSAADCRIRRCQRRKQTRLKRKTRSEKRKEKKKKNKKKKKERNKESPSSTTGAAAAAAEASSFQFFALNSPTIGTSTIFYPSERARSADKNTATEKKCFSIQTSREHQQQQQEYQLNSTMADDHGYMIPNLLSKKKEQVRVFVRRRRRTIKPRKRIILHSSSSGNSQETIPSESNTMEELVSFIKQQINKKKRKKSRDDKNIIVVNYKPVFVNSRQQKSSPPTTKTSTTTIPKPKPVPTDDEFSSATHYSRRRSLTATTRSSDDSPLRSIVNRSHNEQSISLDVPDVEDPLMFIEMMYQQLFTEDGRLRSGTEPTALANCVKQIVTNSRRNSISSSIANGSTSSHLKHINTTTNHLQRKLPTSPSYHHLITSKPVSLSSSPRLIPNEQYNTFSEEEGEEEVDTLVQTNNQHPVTKKNIDISKRSSKRSSIDNTDNHSQIHAFLNSCHQRRSTTNNAFRFSMDDTDNEDLDTFSDLNSTRFNNKTIRTSPSVDEDLTQTDSRLLSSSGYQSLYPSGKSLKQQQQQQPIITKSRSENDLVQLLSKRNNQLKCIHYCPNCIHPPHVTVIPPMISPSSLNLLKRIQQPIGEMFMRYLNFILISKNVLLLPLFLFLLRQRSLKIGK